MAITGMMLDPTIEKTDAWRSILGCRVDAVTYASASERVFAWAEARESRYVCVANVHVVMEAVDDVRFQAVLNEADLVTPDGMPLVWALKLLGMRRAERVYGPNLMVFVCQMAAEYRIPVALLGGTARTLQELCGKLIERFPKLEIAYSHSPPFRELAVAEELAIAASINRSGAQILFVGLGCPKQERFMARQRGRIRAPMLGVGAAFDFIAGVKPMAPTILQKTGLEWLFRLATEPRRLWKRYLKHNPRFVWYFGRQLFQSSGVAQ